jgi:hypothetical protein
VSVCASAGKVNGVRTRGSDEEDKGSSNDEETVGGSNEDNGRRDGGRGDEGKAGNGDRKFSG